MKPIEVRMFATMARNAAIALPPMALLALLLRGWNGALSVAIAVGLVLGVFALSAFPMAWASKISSGLVGITAGVGFLFRLILVGVVFLALSAKPFIDKPSFMVAFMLSYLGLIAMEARAWITYKPGTSPVAASAAEPS